MKFEIENPAKRPEQSNINPELVKDLKELRKRVHDKMRRESKKRLETNPAPTEAELRLGAFVEWIEPQVREAVIEMNRKGYGTTSSGFYDSYQVIDGYFLIDDETEKKVKAAGGVVLTGADIGAPMNKIVRQIAFYPDKADVESMKVKWNTIAAALPMRQGGPQAISNRAEQFREEYAPNHPSFEKEIREYISFIRKNQTK